MPLADASSLGRAAASSRRIGALVGPSSVALPAWLRSVSPSSKSLRTCSQVNQPGDADHYCKDQGVRECGGQALAHEKVDPKNDSE
jgi:hypothetical protein